MRKKDHTFSSFHFGPRYLVFMEFLVIGLQRHENFVRHVSIPQAGAAHWAGAAGCSLTPAAWPSGQGHSWGGA